MAKNTITTRFTLVSVGSVLLLCILSKIFQIFYMISASDIMASDLFTMFCRIGFELLAVSATAMTVSAAVYAYSYFGIKTALKSSGLLLGALTLGKILMFVYNMIANSLTAGKLFAGAISYLVEILFDALVIALSLFFAIMFAKRRAKIEYSKCTPMGAAFAGLGSYFLILIADLTFMNVIPFFVSYSDPTTSEIKTIISDYLYYVISAPLTMLIAILCFFVLTKITGKLKLKEHFRMLED